MARAGVVTEEQTRLLTLTLRDLMAQSEAAAVFLTDQGGNTLASVAPAAYQKAENIAALAAGSFSATRELASLIGEKEFRSVHHKGEVSSIYIHSAAGSHLILVIFSRDTPVGLVKLYVEKAVAELDPVLKALSGQDTTSSPPPPGGFELDESVTDIFAAPPAAMPPAPSPSAGGSPS